MNPKFLLLCVVVLGAITIASSLSSASCPPASRIDSCSPQCKDNCQGSKVCCTNICGSKTCVDIYQYQGGNKGDKYSSNNKQGSTGSYCGNTKCSSGEKCEMDRSTKRMKCVRG